jgi:trans-2,3-dihydro-3-hydroxyanthranilate isomerase
MKYTFHIVDVFSSTPFGGNQLAVVPDASSISTEGMQKIAREFNFGETTFVLPKKDPANTCRVRIFTPRAELDFAGAPSVGTACALVMKQHVRLSDPVQLILEENVGPVTVDVAQRNGGFHGTLTLSGKIEAPTGAPSPTELAAVLSVEPAAVSQVFFAGVGVPLCFAQLNSNEAVDRAVINRAAWAATLSRAWSPHIFFFAGNLRDGGKLYARMWGPALGVEEDPATGSACAALVGAMASKHDFGGTAYRLSIQQGVLMGRRSGIEAEARKSGGVVTSVSVGGATAYTWVRVCRTRMTRNKPCKYVTITWAATSTTRARASRTHVVPRKMRASDKTLTFLATNPAESITVATDSVELLHGWPELSQVLIRPAAKPDREMFIPT